MPYRIGDKTMAREDQIAIASCAYGSRGSSIDFTVGAKWADSNPKSPWISVEDDLPCNNPDNIYFGFTTSVLAIDDKNNTFMAFMMKGKDNKWVWDSSHGFAFLDHITHWMPIPKLPKE